MNFLQLKLFMGTYDLFAYVEIARWTTDRATSDVSSRYHTPRGQKILIGNFATQKKAEDEILKLKHIYVEAAQPTLVLPDKIAYLEIIEVP